MDAWGGPTRPFVFRGMRLMNGLLKSFFCALILSALSSLGAHAQTINAATCNSSDVQNALNSVVTDGTVVKIPSGSCTWSSSVTYNLAHSTVIQGTSTISGTCAPGGSCSATDNLTITFGNGVTFSINTASGKSFRLTGVSLVFSGSTAKYGSVNIGGSSTSVRVDHNHFDDRINGDHTFNVDGINGVFVTIIGIPQLSQTYSLFSRPTMAPTGMRTQFGPSRTGSEAADSSIWKIITW